MPDYCSGYAEIGEEEIRMRNTTMLADSGAYKMAINETIQAKPELPLIEMQKVQLADSRVAAYAVVGPVMVQFANRKATFNAFVLLSYREPLLAAIPMKELDVMIHPNAGR